MTSNAHSAPPQFLSWLTATLHYLLATSKRSTSSSKMEMTELLVAADLEPGNHEFMKKWKASVFGASRGVTDKTEAEYQR